MAVGAQLVAIPDPNFKTILLNASSNIGIASNGLSAIQIDTNNNGEIEQSEALTVIELRVGGANISDLTGIEAFTNLKLLNVAGNLLTSINVSTLTQLETLGTFHNQLTAIDLSANVNLIYFQCKSNQLTQLDFSALPHLKWVNCQDNVLSSLDFSNNPLFEDLSCMNNPNLTSIKIKNGRQQVLGSQMLNPECWTTGTPNLNYICADDFEIASIQTYLSGCGGATLTIDSACPMLETTQFSTAKTTIALAPNPSNGIVRIQSENTFDEVTIYTVLGQQIATAKLSQTQEIDLQLLPAGTYFLKLKNSKV